ncbi:hypothetical protein [Thermococcus litoralis]|uniref:hypothetical protein n=1 Tax=Thermococcus litoralis TaxID=2265 RepID=UPI000B357E41|nr:hypothetical protein [Thermococcus litoralis]
MERYPEEIAIPINTQINWHLPKSPSASHLRPKLELDEPSSAGESSKLELVAPLVQPQPSKMRVPLPSKLLSLSELKERMEIFLKEEFRRVPLIGVTKYRSPEDEKEEILVFIKVERHPYRAIKEIYKKLQEKEPELAEIVQLLPSFD